MAVTSGRTTWSGVETVLLHAGEAELEVALLGATALRWSLPLLGEPWDVLDGYRSPAELTSQDGVRNGVMAPFCNRVRDGRYTFDGQEHDLLPGSADRTIYHGLVRTEPFTVVLLDQRADGATVRLRCTALEGGTAVGYPYRVAVEVTYTLRPSGLDLLITGRNLGDRAAPYASGWHPYFRLPGPPTIDRLLLDLPATTAVLTDDALFPLTGDAAYRRHDSGPSRPFGSAVIDAAFADLQSQDGSAVTVLADPRTGVRLALRQERGLVHVFTGDTLRRDRRASVAVEPVEAMTDAFNRPDCRETVLLAPGGRRDFRISADVMQGPHT